MYTSVVRALAYHVEGPGFKSKPQSVDEPLRGTLLTPTYSPRVRAQGTVCPVLWLHQGRLADVTCWVGILFPCAHTLLSTAYSFIPCSFEPSCRLLVISEALQSCGWHSVLALMFFTHCPGLLWTLRSCLTLVCKCRQLLTYFLISWKNLYFLELYKWYHIMWTFSGGRSFNWAQLILESCIL